MNKVFTECAVGAKKKIRNAGIKIFEVERGAFHVLMKNG